MNRKPENKPAFVYDVDEKGRHWVTLQEAARISEICDKTLYAAVYRAGTGRRPTIPHRYIKEHPRQHRGTLCVPIEAVIQYRIEEIEHDAQKNEAGLRAVLTQYGVSDKEFQTIVGEYVKAFEQVIGEVRAKGLGGIVNEATV